MNEKLINHFEVLSEYYNITRETFKAKAFRNALSIIKQFPDEITSGNQLEHIKGIGKSTVDEINVFLRTGTSERLNNANIINTLKLLTSVYGIGPAKASELYDLGVRSIADLENVELTSAQRIGVKYHAELLERIPRSEMDTYVVEFTKLIGEPLTDETPTGIFSWSIVGSYRRGENTSGDIDLICREGYDSYGNLISLNDIVNTLIVRNIITDTLARGSKKFMGICKLDGLMHRRIDIRMFKESEWAFALLYSTGSAKLNIIMRNRAEEFGLKLNEYSLYPYKCNTEREIFNVLHMDYLEPYNRRL